MDWEELQRSWDEQQESDLPDREDRFAAMLDVVEAVAGPAARVLDLAGGTGSITRRLLARFPAARAVIVDFDPVLLAIAAETFTGDERVTVTRTDLNHPSWAQSIPVDWREFDAVLTATALHWLEPSRVARVYAEARSLLRPGGVLGNADHMPDPGLTDLGVQLAELLNHRTEQHRLTTGYLDWEQWWARIRDVPELAAAFTDRNDAPSAAHTQSVTSSAWHIDALHRAGYGQAGLAWRGLTDALVVGVR